MTHSGAFDGKSEDGRKDAGDGSASRSRRAGLPVPKVSFEFFPPKSLAGSFRLWEALGQLAPLSPDFVSVTYGAGGTTRKLTHEAVTTIKDAFGLDVAAHLTCVEQSRAETLEIAESYAAAGIRRLVALRGDPPGGAGPFVPHPEGFANSAELVAALTATGRFEIAVGAYPEGHPEEPDIDRNIDWLKRKFDAGASSAITQFFFDTDAYLRFRDKAAAAGIDGPIIPGILPIGSWDGVKRFAARCGARLPGWMDDAFRKAEAAGPERVELLSVTIATELATRLLEEGVEQLHFFTLNRPGLTRRICTALGVTPEARLEEVA